MQYDKDLNKRLAIIINLITQSQYGFVEISRDWWYTSKKSGNYINVIDIFTKNIDKIREELNKYNITFKNPRDTDKSIIFKISN